MWLYSCLEEEQAGGTILGGNNFLASGVEYTWHFINEWHHITQELHETAHTHILTCTYTEHGEHTTCGQAFADTFAHLVLSERFTLEKLFHQSFIVLGCSFHQCLMHLHSLVHFLGRDFLYGGLTTFGAPRILLHQKYVYEGIETRTCLQRILNGYHLGTIHAGQLLEDSLVVTVLIIQLIDQEDDGLAQFLCIAEMVLRTYLQSNTTFEQEHCSVCHIESRHGSTHKIITSRTIDNVQLLVVPLHMEHSGKHTISVFLLNGEIITYCVMLGDASTTLYHSCLIKKRFCKGGLTRSIIAKQGNVLNLVCLISFHIFRLILLVCYTFWV